jgi:GTPase SAR1 family protein
MREIENLHLERLEKILFNDPIGTPPWLRDAPRKCRDRYSNIQLTDQFKSAINAFDDEDNPKPFELFVLGEGKFGKSTIVNCLLGEELSKVQGLPETRCFHRYVFKNNPNKYTKLFLKTKPEIHDWLTSQLKEGKEVKDLYEILEYQVSHNLAQELVKEDVFKQEQGGYEQAIYEIERDVKRNDFSPFKREIRIVDTQGLDQIFPDDIRSAIQSNESSSRESSRNWMRDTPRGLHLDWQFRRCDAVLWCINAKRLGSAATREYLSYFSDYSKKIVIALTHIDIARNDREHERLIAKAREMYSQYSDTIIPVNGRAAWESISNPDQMGYENSGMKFLVNKLVDVSDRDGVRVRNVARYKGLRQTEKQYRNALNILRRDYIALKEKHSHDLRLVNISRENIKKELLKIAKKRGSEVLNEILAGVDLITMKDDVNEAESKLKINSKSRIFRDYILDILERFLLSEISKLNDGITPYQIPSFDADGERSGHAVSHYVDTLYVELEITLPSPRLQLSDLWGKFANFVDGFLGLFSDEAKRRKAQRLITLQLGIRDELLESWEEFIRDAEENISRETNRQYENILDSIDRVMEKIKSDLGGNLPQTISEINHSLSGIAVPNVIINEILKMFKKDYGLNSFY